ncbi:hypothetical protein [Bdellovibrio svalbardensis]|uniref:Phosphatidate cytidylyltransferase n=1 Tax=Bdellovibrio svalbardensis TaxID=2972972 RepID=A0ABT6DFP2_9BACT|nr:hypothetical protein [Bdellovibrio svalbardensis]MDG0815670.1 hypothetical protein [Bdellovibrio svalbardensis]
MKNKQLILKPWTIYAFFGSIFFFPSSAIPSVFSVALIFALGTLEKWSEIRKSSTSQKTKYLAQVIVILVLIIGNLRYGFSNSMIAQALSYFHLI